MSRLYKFIALMLLVSSSVFAQFTLSGKVTSAQTGEALVGANVILKGTTYGAATDENGNYSFDADRGRYTLACSYIGFEKQEVSINLTNDMVSDFSLRDYEFSLNVTVIADRAKDRETPVAYTQVDKKDMQTSLGSRDIPLILNTTPSVYSTMQGGAAGDARINIRGFNQTNIGIMINGVPMNDMENGWLYWSNWDGLSDATSSIEIQRGLSAVNLAIASIGGTMNIVTDPMAQQFGVYLNQEFGTSNFLKTTLAANSGLIDGKWAFNAVAVRKTGDGIADKTWTDAWAYYFGAAYNINENNRLELYAIGAPQQHGQRRYLQNIAAFNKGFALSLPDYDPAAADKYFEDDSGIKYNENWSPVTVDYTSQEYYDGGLHDRYATDYNNESVNYYHKPLVNLNWYSLLSNRFSLYTTVYYSGGMGGSKGTFGSMVWDRVSHPSQVVNWDATIARNQTNATGSRGIMRNSVNQQWTIGALAKINFKVADYLNTSFGIDWRTAEVDHFREVRDLLGGAYFISTNNQFDTTPESQQKALGDKIDYNNTNSIDWLGGYGQAEYSSGPITAFGMFGYTMVKYSYVDHFKKDPNDPTQELTLDPDALSGWQAKGGLSYRLSDLVDVYSNFGYVKRVPMFDNVIDDVNAKMAAGDPESEKFTSAEVGLNYISANRTVAFRANYYYTIWKDRTSYARVINPDGSEDFIYLTGMNSLHRGLELAATYFPMRQFKLEAAVSFGHWTYTDDVNGEYVNYSSGSPVQTFYHYYVKDLRVGDSPQTQASLVATLYPISGMTAQLVMNTYRDYYAYWSPFSRTTATDTKESWRAPAYTVFDFHFAYDLPFDFYGVNLQVFAHVFNLFDKLYIQDATDNSSYNSWDKDHDADDAEVFFGLPRSVNFGVRISY
ncbi:MAG: TonB-dependent receptor [Ignavibacteria bacterium RBG_13_36_8]|nr:MAG: TonB-dependent receptor [Ignavibacteria bacterium RBG_13_36_8]